MYGRHVAIRATSTPSARPRSVASPASPTGIEAGHHSYDPVARGRPYFHWPGRGLEYFTTFHGWMYALSEYPVVNHLPSCARRMTSETADQNAALAVATISPRHPMRPLASAYVNSTTRPMPTKAP